MKAHGYVRVSTEGQALDGVSLDTQREKIVGYCALHGLELAEIFGDDLSGKRADNRPGLQAALRSVCKARGVLVVYSLSRFARSTMDCIHLAERIRKCGAQLASISEKLDTSSAMGEFFFTIMAALGQLERKQISERTTAALAHMRNQGRRISRHAPYGYRIATDGKKLEPVPVEQIILKKLRSMRHDGASYNAIAVALNDSAVPSKNGGKWLPGVLLRIMNRDAKLTSQAGDPR